LSIDCQIDLEGQTVNLPSNVTLNFNGGEIINGKLVFNGGNIDGDLLNQFLELEGDVALVDPVFQFHPERWDFVQGQTTSDRAQLNNFNLEGLFFMTKDLGATTFVMGEFDAYFEVSKVTSTTTNQNFYPTVESVNVPGNFTLQMSDNTILRVFPTIGEYSASLIGVHNTSNATIRGGVLYGDRDIRTYSKPNAEEGSHLMTIKASTNVTVDGVKFTMGSLGGLNVNSLGFTFNSDYIPTNGVTIRNCVFDKDRMMSIAITDGFDIIIEDNNFIDTAQNTPNSDGGVVGYAINLEPVRTRDQSTGELINYQKVHDVVIRNNRESGSWHGAFIIYLGDNIIIEDNEVENVIAWNYATNSKVRNNTFRASGDNPTKPAILAAGLGETVYGNEISGNRMYDYNTGITIYTGRVKIFDNIIENSVNGIALNDLIDTEVYDNEILSSVANSRGIAVQNTNANNVSIFNNDIAVENINLSFIALNQDAGQGNNNILVEGNSLNSSAVVQFSSASGVMFTGNTSSGRVQMGNTSNVDLVSNVINSPDGHGIALINVNTDISITGNTISTPDNFNCININSSTNPGEVNQSGNNCN
jgi:hypothetical protein